MRRRFLPLGLSLAAVPFPSTSRRSSLWPFWPALKIAILKFDGFLPSILEIRAFLAARVSENNFILPAFVVVIVRAIVDIEFRITGPALLKHLVARLVSIPFVFNLESLP